MSHSLTTYLWTNFQSRSFCIPNKRSVASLASSLMTANAAFIVEEPSALCGVIDSQSMSCIAADNYGATNLLGESTHQQNREKKSDL